MKAKLVDLTVSLDGKQRLTLELDGDFRPQWDEFHGKDVDITVKKYRLRRSDEANAYCWVLIDKIARKTRTKKIEVYRNAIREIGGTSEMVYMKKNGLPRLKAEWDAKGLGWQVEEIGSKTPGWTNVILYYGSSSYDTEQMSLLIDSLVQDAKALGIETEIPEKVQNMLEDYNAQFNYRPRTARR